MSVFTPAIDTQAFAATSLATTVLLVKFLMTVGIQGGHRFKAGSRPPEDAKLGLASKIGKGVVQNYGVGEADKNDDPKVKKAKMDSLRWNRIVMNDLENIPFGLIAAWSSLLAPFSAKVHTVLVLGFAAARVFHTIVYAKELQPHRGAAWGAGWVFIFGLAANGLLGALSLLAK
ncbi:uncharacterized protein EV422DRAFT_68085 [Fimicolochytrium jonesii]|uniref:uncharacterized protein n=1 Tax=Fimicolochytrium jonesii TaxID=1396493 RepID=UPI0022FEC263|nr:uncharacterized protein EV422DRAFT_68085 [Fimicolochytrium jonesii]KAI8820373.1 hypothetical protein EV422DRAFT_68085 [Fimicolochytrium jonesii]